MILKNENNGKNNMDIFTAVFNCHVNRAQDKARRDFISDLGRDVYMREIYPFVRKGIMSIFKSPENKYTIRFAKTIQHYVNESPNLLEDK